MGGGSWWNTIKQFLWELEISLYFLFWDFFRLGKMSSEEIYHKECRCRDFLKGKHDFCAQIVRADNTLSDLKPPSKRFSWSTWVRNRPRSNLFSTEGIPSCIFSLIPTIYNKVSSYQKGIDWIYYTKTAFISLAKAVNFEGNPIFSAPLSASRFKLFVFSSKQSRMTKLIGLTMIIFKAVYSSITTKFTNKNEVSMFKLLDRFSSQEIFSSGIGLSSKTPFTSSKRNHSGSLWQTSNSRYLIASSIPILWRFNIKS